MAKTKQTIARFIDEYEVYLNKLDKSIGAVEQEHARWVKAQRDFKETWAGQPVVANVLAQHSQQDWTAALQATDVPELHNIRMQAEDSIEQLHQSQELVRKTIQHCVVKQPELEARLTEVDSVLGKNSDALKNKKDTFDRATKDQQDNHSDWLDHYARKWKLQSARERPPSLYDYDAPQPWWAQPWILTVINPTMKRNMEESNKFKEKTGLSLFAAAQGHARRTDAHTQAEREYVAAKKEYSRVEKLHLDIMDARSSNDITLARSKAQVLPASGPGSIAAHEQSVRQTALENAIRYCIMNNIDKVGPLQLALPDAELAAQRAGKLVAMQQVAQSIEQSVESYSVGRDNVEKNIAQLQTLAKKHTRHANVTIDTANIRSMVQSVEDNANQLRTRFKAARATMQRPTPFTTPPASMAPQTSASFSSSSSSTTSTSSNDSMFWTMAWIYLLSSGNPAHATSPGLVEPDANGVPTLDADKFQREFDNANGGLGLSSQFTVENSLVEVETLRSHDGGASISTGSNVLNIDTSPMQVEVSSGGGSSWGSSSLSSHGNTVETTSGGWGTGGGGTETAAPAASPGASCAGGSCGGGGGDP